MFSYKVKYYDLIKSKNSRFMWNFLLTYRNAASGTFNKVYKYHKI